MATDKRLDQVSQLTDFDYALIVKGDQVAKASKQQLAELVGNLLYGATTKETLALVVAGQLSAGIVIRENVDTILEPGYYGHGSGLFDEGTHGVLIVFKSSYYKYFVQVDLSFGVGFYYRVSHGDGNWSPWVKL